jgi:uncharacterized integral membrane protein (TIGR00698 family)
VPEGRPLNNPALSKALFFIGILLSATGVLSPPLALLFGLVFGFAVQHPYPAQSRRTARFLLQASVVLLGFGMNLHQVIETGRSGFVYTALTIVFAMAVGLGLGYLIRVQQKPAFLISAGTAICGGSAIAAVGPITHASDEEMAVALGTVFILNSVALFLFPPIGSLLHLSQAQFGLWSALAIHDTSSVVGAAAKYGPNALAIGTTTKLTRALWIVPMALVTAGLMKSKARIQWPWFILFFCGAALLNSLLPAFHSAFATFNYMGKLGLTATLFLIGTGLNKKTLASVGVRPLLQGVTLWLIVGTTTLAMIVLGWIG